MLTRDAGTRVAFGLANIDRKSDDAAEVVHKSERKTPQSDKAE